MKIAFHSNQIGLRGTEVAIYDYAHFNETLLGNESIILTQRNSPNHNRAAIQKFASRFRVFAYDDQSQIDLILDQQQAEVLYAIKAGFPDGVLSARRRNVVHVVFPVRQPHGDVYAYVSQWLSKFISNGELPFVPHMVHLPTPDRDRRDELRIPTDAMVFGRHGGEDTFDIPFVHESVAQCALANPKRYFLFVNTPRFCQELPNVIHLPVMVDPLEKSRFIATCDAMLHAGRMGESFGLAVGEFSILNRPVLTWSGGSGRCHMEILGDKAMIYHNKQDLDVLLHEFKPDRTMNYDAYSRNYSPVPVMQIFKNVFLT